MRLWLFHPLVFYPLAALIAALVIAISMQPLAWPRDAAPVTAARADAAWVLEGEALGSPAADARQNVTAHRGFWGRTRSLSVAQLPNQPPPGPQDLGVRILLAPDAAAALAGRRVIAEVSYVPLPINPASALALSLQAGETATWVSQPIEPRAGVARFELNAPAATHALGLRALSDGTDQAYGVEITRIVLLPHA